MINIKTPEEIKIMARGGGILAETLSEVLKNIKPGVSELELDGLAERLIREKGGEPGFKRVPGYKHTICVSTNDVVVHGIPTAYRFKEGDVAGIDCGVFYKGFHTDAAQTVRVQELKFPPSPRLRRAGKTQNSDEVDRFLTAGKKALDEAIKKASLGNRVGDISKTIQDIVEGEGYSVVRSLVGHGVGRELHEEPEVPGYLNRNIKNTPLLKENMVIAVEVIYNMGESDVSYDNSDGWTISTKDKSLSGLFERTVAVSKNGPRVLTN